MIDTLITALETVCPNNVYLQGSFEADAEYPESFITFWTNYTDNNAHYNDNVTSIDWQFSVIFYSSDPAIIQTKAEEIRTALKAAGFISQGKGNNIMSDRPSHIGWAMDFIKTEYLLNPKFNIQKVAPYFYKANFEDIDYNAGYEYFRKYKPILGACSAVRKGNFFGRNYDWTYDERVSFLTYTKAKNGRHAVMGAAVGTPALTQEFIESGAASNDYQIIPFMLMDGINDCGLVCEINVVPAGDKGFTRGTNVQGEDLFALMIPRYVLDYASNVEEALQLIQARNIFCADNSGVTQEFHIMIADASRTVVVEFVENEMVVIENFIDDKPIMTNLYLDGYDGTRESLTPYAMGIERQAILTSGYDSVESELEMLNLMTSVLYTKAYESDTSPVWYSEFCGDYGEPYGNLTKDSPPEDYEPILEIARERYASRARNGQTWQTVHTAVYNLGEKKLLVSPQETKKIFIFTF